MTYAPDEIIWSIPTLIMCAVGQAVHWLNLYIRARAASKVLNTAIPSVFMYWWADWPSTVRSCLIVFAGYFVIPEVGRTWPTVGAFFGIVAEDGMIRGLTPFSALLWGMFGAYFGDLAGKRLSKMLE